MRWLAAPLLLLALPVFAKHLDTIDTPRWEGGAAALQAWRIQAERGDALAQFFVGNVYARGYGLAPDVVEAARWYRLAADQGFGLAQLALGSMYRDGRGVPRDLVAAYMWFDLAASQGTEFAASLRNSVALGMSPSEIEEARRRVSAWREDHAPR